MDSHFPPEAGYGEKRTASLKCPLSGSPPSARGRELLSGSPPSVRGKEPGAHHHPEGTRGPRPWQRATTILRNALRLGRTRWAVLAPPRPLHVLVFDAADEEAITVGAKAEP